MTVQYIVSKTVFMYIFRDPRTHLAYPTFIFVVYSPATYSQLQEPENAPMRVSSVAAAGLMGYVLAAVRGRGAVRKALYMALGAGAGAAAVYPKEAKVRGRQFLT